MILQKHLDLLSMNLDQKLIISSFRAIWASHQVNLIWKKTKLIFLLVWTLTAAQISMGTRILFRILKSNNRMIMYQTTEFKTWLKELMITVYQFNRIRIKHSRMKIIHFINKKKTVHNQVLSCKYFCWEAGISAWNINTKKWKLIFQRYRDVLMELFYSESTA